MKAATDNDDEHPDYSEDDNEYNSNMDIEAQQDECSEQGVKTGSTNKDKGSVQSKSIDQEEVNEDQAVPAYELHAENREGVNQRPRRAHTGAGITQLEPTMTSKTHIDNIGRQLLQDSKQEFVSGDNKEEAPSSK